MGHAGLIRADPCNTTAKERPLALPLFQAYPDHADGAVGGLGGHDVSQPLPFQHLELTRHEAHEQKVPTRVPRHCHVIEGGIEREDELGGLQAANGTAYTIKLSRRRVRGLRRGRVWLRTCSRIRSNCHAV